MCAQLAHRRCLWTQPRGSVNACHTHMKKKHLHIHAQARTHTHTRVHDVYPHIAHFSKAYFRQHMNSQRELYSPTESCWEHPQTLTDSYTHTITHHIRTHTAKPTSNTYKNRNRNNNRLKIGLTPSISRWFVVFVFFQRIPFVVVLHSHLFGEKSHLAVLFSSLWLLRGSHRSTLWFCLCHTQTFINFYQIDTSTHQTHFAAISLHT